MKLQSWNLGSHSELRDISYKYPAFTEPICHVTLDITEGASKLGEDQRRRWSLRIRSGGQTLEIVSKKWEKTMGSCISWEPSVDTRNSLAMNCLNKKFIAEVEAALLSSSTWKSNLQQACSGWNGVHAGVECTRFVFQTVLGVLTITSHQPSTTAREHFFC